MKRRPEGSALPLTILMLLTAFILIGAAGLRSQSAVRNVALLKNRIEAGYAAEAAMNIALAKIGQGERSGQVSFSLDSAAGACWFGDNSGSPEILAWGKSGGIERALSCRSWVQQGLGGEMAGLPARVFVQDMQELTPGPLNLSKESGQRTDPAALLARVWASRAADQRRNRD